MKNRIFLAERLELKLLRHASSTRYKVTWTKAHTISQLLSGKITNLWKLRLFFFQCTYQCKNNIWQSIQLIFNNTSLTCKETGWIAFAAGPCKRIVTDRPEEENCVKTVCWVLNVFSWEVRTVAVGLEFTTVELEVKGSV